jgi:hypothetical protein
MLSYGTLSLLYGIYHLCPAVSIDREIIPLTHLDNERGKWQNGYPMDVKFAVLADYASITREGKLNVLGIFDTINALAFPTAVPLFFVVVSYEAGAAEVGSIKQVEIVLCDEDGKHLLALPQELKVGRPQMSGTMATANQIAGIVGFQFSQAGSYQFDILVNGDSKKTISLRINQIVQEKGAK